MKNIKNSAASYRVCIRKKILTGASSRDLNWNRPCLLNQNNSTYLVSDFQKAVNWYVQFFNHSPIYLDPMWAIFESAGEKICIENSLLVGQIDMASEYIDRQPALQEKINEIKNEGIELGGIELLDALEEENETFSDHQHPELVFQYVSVTIH